MKTKILLIAISVLFLSCKKDKTKEEVTNQPKSVLISAFLKDVHSLETAKKPIKQFIEEANKEAAKKADLTKSNIKEVLKEAEGYAAMVIVVENHTIVKIEDVKKCKNSGAWATCMPYATGFIKKGKLIFKEDYCNNIIGIPDSQHRTVYFFK